MTQWICLGQPPRTSPCGAAGDTDAAAEDHVETTGHSVVTGNSTAVLERAAARFKADAEKVGGGGE